MTALSACEGADFLFLERLTGPTEGNLTAHRAKLEAAGLVAIEKRFLGKTPNTLVQLTTTGREDIARHWERLEALKQGVQAWKGEDRSAP